jgi:colanic acid biosynthesis glycosyl transferase WcaI
MRFLFLTQYYPPELGAPQLRLSSVIRELVRRGHEAEVVTALPNYPTGHIFPDYQGRFYAREVHEGVTVHRVWLYASTGAGLKRLINYLSFTATALYGLMRAKKPDYLFIESPPLFLSMTGFIVSRLRGIPYIFNVADLWPDTVQELGLMEEGRILRLARKLEKWSYRKAAYVNAATEGLYTTILKKGVPADKLLFLPNGVDTEQFRPLEPDLALREELGLDDRQVILYTGTHGYVHGIEVALQAAKQLENEPFFFLFVGDGSDKPALIDYAKELGLTNVRFLDPVPPSEIGRFYSLAMAGLSTVRDFSLAEGIRPVKIYAIMATGKPVLYSGSGEGAELVKEGDAGIVTAPGDPQELADAIRSLVEDPRRCRQMGANGRRYVEEKFSWAAIVGKWLDDLAGRSPSLPMSNRGRKS